MLIKGALLIRSGQAGSSIGQGSGGHCNYNHENRGISVSVESALTVAGSVSIHSCGGGDGIGGDGGSCSHRQILGKNYPN